MAYTLIDDATDEVVPTDNQPIVKPGLGLRLECHSCGDVFDQDDADVSVPLGHKKFTRLKCPECGARCARKWGTNRQVEEEYLRLTVREAFDKAARDEYENVGDYFDKADVDPDAADLVGGSAVDPDEVGDTVIAVFEYYPSKGVTNFLPIGQDDVGPNDRHDDIPAQVEWYDGIHKPIGYPDEWDEDLAETADDLAPTGESIIRLVRVA